MPLFIFIVFSRFSLLLRLVEKFNFVTYGAFLLFSEFGPKSNICQEAQSQKRQLKSSGILLMLRINSIAQ